MRRPRRPDPPSKSWPAPTRGWIANKNLAEPEANGAFILDNMFPGTETIRMRGGKLLYATVGDGTVDVIALLSYKFGNAKKLFATTPGAIYDITTVVDSGTTPTADITGQTNGNWVGAQMINAGGSFLRIVNGADASQIYNGTAWSTGTIYDSTDLALADITATFHYIFTSKKRYFFLKDNLDAYYLPVETISGPAIKLPLGSVFKLGGSLLFGGTWSQDVGDGLQAFTWFGTNEGEIAVFAGANPSDAADWAHVGTYRIGRPMGKKALFQAGGDVVVATDIGLTPMSAARERDVAAQAPASASWPIHSAWLNRVENRGFAAWHCELWPTANMVLVAVPSSDDYAPEMLIANSVTGAWCRYTNWDATCIEIYDKRGYIGSPAGQVFLLETTGADSGTPYTATCLLHFDYLRSPVANKIPLLCRAELLAREQPTISIFVNANRDATLPTAPDAPVIQGESIWDDPGSLWDEALWSLDQDIQTYFTDWHSVTGYEGKSLAPGIRITSGNIQPPRTRLASFDLIYKKTGIVV